MKPAIWGGIECTVNRVGNTYFDQLKLNGHDIRQSDLERFAAIGLQAIRYPVLWERTAPEAIADADWTWADERLPRLRELGLRPIVGFLHHGSGPRHTSLLDPEFPRKLSEYARAFATRFPWVEDYTPINEILTTARFSCLYGVWYPHAKDDASCFRAVLNECRATALCMREIRAVNPAARLIQTDDLGRASSVPKLAYQAAYENDRRWLGWDLLCGRVTREHPLWERLLATGIQPEELLWHAQNPCPPDVIGVNHYLLSNRHLDDRLERYPAWSHGGNDRDRYADIESVRVADAAFIPPKDILREAWERYRIPVAVTEIHLNGGREEQLRWYMEIWNAACELNDEGARIVAMTAWGLLGHFDWHCLVSRCEGVYEAGVFDVRAREPRPTAVVRLLGSLAQGQDFNHPVLAVPGWWRRSQRVCFPSENGAPEPGTGASFGNPRNRVYGSARPLVITGGGALGSTFARVCERRGIPYRLLSRAQLDIVEDERVREMLEGLRPWAVVNAAGYMRVDEAEAESERCFRENALGPGVLARECARRQVGLASFSSDLVFDGKRSDPYLESAIPAPLSAFGRSKVEGEARVSSEHPAALLVRTSACFGPWDRENFLTMAMRSIRQGSFLAADDLVVSPTYTPDLAEMTLDLLLDGESGLWHLANGGAMTWAEFARRAARAAGLDSERVISCPTSRMNWAAARPAYSVLGSERGKLLPDLEPVLERYLAQGQWREAA